MKILIVVLSINFLSLLSGDESNEIRIRLNQNKDIGDNTFNEQDQLKSEPKCNEKCECLPNVTTEVFSPLKELKITEDTVLMCSEGSKIKRLQLINSQYKYNMTCNGVIATNNSSDDHYFIAIFEIPDESEKMEKKVIRVRDLDTISHFNQGSESNWERAIIANTDCEGDIILSSGHWVAQDPLYGCCGQGVNHWTAVHYRVEIKGKCCSTCDLLQSSFTSETILKNY